MTTAEQLSRLGQAIEQMQFLNRAILKREGVKDFGELTDAAQEQYDENLAILRQLYNFRSTIENALNTAYYLITTNQIV